MRAQGHDCQDSNPGVWPGPRGVSAALARLGAVAFATAKLLAASDASATLFFQSGEETLAPDSPLPEPKWGPYNDAWRECRRGHVRALADAPEGARAIEFEALASCYVGTTDANHDTFNELQYDVPPPAGGTLYTGVFFRTARIAGRNLWSDPDPGVETFDKAIELVGPSYRWTTNMGTRDHYYSAGSEFDGKFSLFFGHPNPGHFNTEAYHCGPSPQSWEDYDSYWQNMTGYGGSRPDTECYPNNPAQPFWMSYDQWYSIVTKVVFRVDDTGSIEAWINGVQVLGVYDIQTCGAEPCEHTRAQLWGTYSQPAYGGPDHRRLIDALVVTDDPAYLQAGGYFRAPASAAFDAGPGPDAEPLPDSEAPDAERPAPDADASPMAPDAGDASPDSDGEAPRDADAENARTGEDRDGGLGNADARSDVVFDSGVMDDLKGRPSDASSARCGCSSSSSEGWSWAGPVVAALALLRGQGRVRGRSRQGPRGV